MKILERMIVNSHRLSDSVLGKKIDTYLHIHTEAVQNDGKDTFHCHRYEPSPYRVLQALFDQIPLTATDTLLDYGSGMGRLNFYAHHLFQCGAIGVEMVPQLHRQALKNLGCYRGANRTANRTGLKFVQAAAEEYELDDHINYIYCFNPFSTDIFRSVMTRIEESYERSPREITLILYYPEDSTIFYIEKHTSFQLKTEIPIQDLIGENRRERFSIYQLSDTTFS